MRDVFNFLFLEGLKMKTTGRILLSLCIAAMLISCFSAAAFADNDEGYIKYTMKSGDSVAAVCANQKIDFGANERWITAVNHITNYYNIAVGRVIYLPTFNTLTDANRANEVASKLTGGTAVATTTAATQTTTTATTATTAAVPATTVTTGLKPGDTIVSYLINHVLQSGETVGAVCARLGVDFDSNADKIKALSGIDNYYHIAAGKVIVIPSLTAPQGSSYTAIVAHRVVGGETVGSICNDYGLNFGKVQAQLKALNSTDNLDRIRVGQTFYLPVPGAVNPTPGPGPSPVPGKAYKMTTQGSAHGTFVLQVNGTDVTAASKDAVVQIAAYPEAGYKVNTVTVMKTTGEEAVAVNSMSFKMPEYDVVVSVTFKAA